MLATRVVFSFALACTVLVSGLSACDQSTQLEMKEGETTLRGKTITVGKVMLTKYQPKDVSRFGIDPAGLDSVVQGFALMIEEGRHSGAQLAVYREGELVLALAGGGDVVSGEQITFDSLFCMRSCTKGLTALVMAVLYDRGLFNYDDPVAKYWPEFAQNGKGNITIGQVMSHRAGIPQGLPIPFHQYGNREAIASAIEGLSLRWAPGTANGYHASTYGWVLDELAMRLTGRNIASLLQTEITGPLGIKDVYIGLPESEFPRFRPLAVLDPTTAERAYFSDFINSPEGRKLPLPWVAGVANAWDLARVFNILAFDGTFEGHTFLKKETQALITRPTNSPGDMDLVLQWPVRWGLGLITGDTPDVFGTAPHSHAIGHAGGGASVVWADPDKHLAVAFLCNGMRTGGREWERYRILGDLIYASLSR